MQYGQDPPPGHTVAHLNDPHLLADRVRQYGVIDTEASLTLALDSSVPGYHHGDLTADQLAWLADVVAGTDVRCILAGHLHYSTYSTFAGIPVPVASATCHTSDPAPLERFVSGVDGHRVVHTIVPVGEAAEVSGFRSDVRVQVEALGHEERREILSPKDSSFYAGAHDLPGHV